MKRIRTISAACNEIKEQDPHSSITPFCVRQLVISGECPSFKNGRTYLLDLDILLSVLSGETVNEPKIEEMGGFTPNKIRRIEA